MILINTPIRKLQNKKDLGEIENSLKLHAVLWIIDETASLGIEYENIEKFSSSRFSMIFKNISQG